MPAAQISYSGQDDVYSQARLVDPMAMPHWVWRREVCRLFLYTPYYILPEYLVCCLFTYTFVFCSEFVHNSVP